MNINVFNVIILVGIVQGILFSIVLLASKKFNKEKANVYMAIVVLCFSLTNLQSWMIDAKVTEATPSLVLFYLPWEMLCPPAFYMFTVHYLNVKNQHKFCRLLYLPFVAFLSIYVYYKIDVLFVHPERDLYTLGEEIVFKFEEGIIILFTFLNGYFVYRILKKHKKETQNDSSLVNVDVNWFATVFKMTIGLCILWAVTVLFQILTESPFGSYGYYPVWIGFTFFAYWIGYTGIYKLAIHQERNTANIKTQHIIEPIKVNPIGKSKTPPARNDCISSENAYYQKLILMLRKEKIYLDPLLSLEQVATQLGISANYLSQLINKITSKHFSDIIGEYRVEEVKDLLNKPDYDKYTILSIGYEAGFNSKSAIYKTFKKFTGITPSEYRDQISSVIIK